MAEQGTVLFLPLNAPGHLNPSLAIADAIKQNHGHRTVFVVLGETLNSIQDHGHELIVLEDVCRARQEDGSVSRRQEGENSQGTDSTGFSKSSAREVVKELEKLEKDLGNDPLKAHQAITRMIGADLVPRSIKNFDQVARVIDSVNPQLIVTDTLLPHIKLVKEQQVRPWVRINSANPIALAHSKLPNGLKPPKHVGCALMTKEKRERMRREEPEKWRTLLKEWARVSEQVAGANDKATEAMRRLYMTNGVEPMPRGSLSLDSPHLNIYMFPEAIDYTQDDDLFEYPPRWFRCDSLVRKSIGRADAEEIELWAGKIDEAMARGRTELIYFSLGSLASGNLRLMRRFIGMLSEDANEKRLYVVSKGTYGDQLELAGDNMIGCNYLPQSYLLQRSHLAIIHGGNNSVTECAYYGKPMIVLPVFVDQFDNAQRIEDLGLGRRLNSCNCSKEQLLGAIDDIMNDERLLAKMRSIGERMQSRDDSIKVAAVLDRLLRERHLNEETIRVFARGAFEAASGG